MQCSISIASANYMMLMKADGELVRRQNRHLVLEALRLHGPNPRIELGRLTGLSLASITSITTKLIEEKAILELEDDLAREPVLRGRPKIRVQLNPNAAHIIAMKISIDGIELALADFSGRIVARKTVQMATFEMSPDSFTKVSVIEIRNFLASNKMRPREIVRLGIAVQGVADTLNGSIAWSPAFRARNIKMVGPLEVELGISCMIANDANMIAEGVMARELYRSRGTTAVVFMGYGVGMGLVIDGEVYHGASGAAAEFGHMNHVPGGALCRCGRAGCLEAYVSDYGILRNAENLPDDTAPPFLAVEPSIMLALEAAARRGDVNASSAYQKAGRAIGFGLARLVALLNPDRIVLAGPGTRALDLIEPSLRQAIEDGVVAELRANLKIETAPIGVDMIIAGTIDAILRQLDSDVFAHGPDGQVPVQMVMGG